jgi:SAM-dependent methyltransferase
MTSTTVWYDTRYRSDVREYYEAKNHGILRRYGPGPVVHWHTGILHEIPDPAAELPTLHEVLRRSQCDAIAYAGNVLRMHTNRYADVIDVGCGLGGGAIYWAHEFGARVRAVTISPGQIEFTNKFARDAGVSERVTTELCDGTAVPGMGRFDVAVALDSSCHMPRRELFSCMARILRPGGVFLMTDGFLEGTPHADAINAHWHMNMGGLSEYQAAASEAGLVSLCLDDLSQAAENFWALTQHITNKEISGADKDDIRAYLQQSLVIHKYFWSGHRDGTIRYRLLLFRKPSGRRDLRAESGLQESRAPQCSSVPGEASPQRPALVAPVAPDAVHCLVHELVSGALADDAARIALQALRADRAGPDGLLYRPMTFFCDASNEAQLVFETALQRCAAVYLLFCVGSLADDLMDGECDYLEAPSKLGPLSQYFFHIAAFRALLEGRCQHASMVRAINILIRCVSFGYSELLSTAWNARQYRGIMENIAGAQFGAYLAILWCGSPLAEKAERVGRAVGTAALVADDLRTAATRYTRLSCEDRVEIATWLRGLVDEIEAERLHCTREIVRAVRTTL